MSTRPNRWDEASVLAEALKYQHRNQFQRQAGGAWDFAKRNGLLEKCYAHMSKPRHPRLKWTPETIRATAAKYDTLTQFRNENGGAYLAMRRLGIEASEVGLATARGSRPRYSLAWLKSKAAPYKTRRDFRANEPDARRIAAQRGLMDEICSHMQPLGHRYKRCVYSIRNGNQVYYGLTADFDQRMYGPHNEDVEQLKPLQDTAIEIVSDGYIDAVEAAEIERTLIAEARNDPSLVCLNRDSGGGLGASAGALQ